ncbi:MAG TPA: trypsin-like peptidase domain-containing protein [Candidatus Saccharimonadales bacterium]|nr:trypsin-like peptidase domain-containing protein [Candidatus Saccharimonadales bacterium]
MVEDQNQKPDIGQSSEVKGTNSQGQPFSYMHKPTKGASRRKLRFLGVAMLLIVSTSAGFAGGYFGRNTEDTSGDIAKQQVVLKTQGQLISNIAKEVGESVVSVEVTSTTGPSDSFFGFQGSTEQQSAGTGIILDKDGLIITNRHVVPSGTTSVSVTLSDGTKFEDVEVIGRTASTDPLDVAFLKIKDTNGNKLNPATVGDSSKMKVGDSVVAIGNALGQFQNTVTSGIVSGFGRSVQASDGSGNDSENLENLFQTDAAINEGNSGGPLVNLEGEVIGINTAVAGDAQNIGFAIPINDVSGLIKSVEDKGKLERPYLGVVFIPITADMAKQYDLGVSQGAYIPPAVMIGSDTVVNGGPAAKAGIEEGDIITKINDDTVDEKHSLTSLLSKHSVGDTVKVTIYHDGKSKTVDVTLGAAPTE